MKRTALKFVVRTLRFFILWIVAGLVVLAVGRHSAVGAFGSVITGIGMVILCVGGAAMFLDQARRMAKHERKQRNKFPRGP